ncbi:hypothetical protein FPOAC1_005443 [Fusarium poae]|uniref:Cytochrome P450 monooxygenase n=1 Tax=Fusarium poae TaxID=36050 RepID=A0A1B8AVH7_FUSPO|nr:hypothetical protein FPOAC1_005443 [Fusarium poae]KAG8672181.1 hypothetical protein FPOAC1_005443 [Fusarium poae]OBS24381.1 hypothetical protein FPOA_04926 [Fusarium poae]
MTPTIPSLDSTESLAILFFSGVIVHVAALRKGEWDLWTIRFVCAWITYEAVTPCALNQLRSMVYFDAIRLANKWLFSFLLGMTSSILIYRGFFHRLNRFPGPFVARLSNIYASWLAIKEEHMYLEVQKLHQKYGDIVRIGPQEISIATPSAFRVLHANNSPISKGPFYNVAHPWVNLLADRDKKRHARRRKTWDKAFTARALRDYEPRVVRYTKQLTDQIEKTKGTPLNIAAWINFYTFDIVGDLAFGTSFNYLVKGVKDKFLTESHQSQVLMGYFRQCTWFFEVFKETPFLNNSWLSFQSWLKQKVEIRRKNKPSEPDVFSWILEEYDGIENPTKADYLRLCGDAHLIAVAGSDTTSAATSVLLHQLTLHPNVLKKLRAEIDEYKANYETPDYVSMSKLKYLQACIDESLRLNPVIMSGLQRTTPPEGMQIDDVFIPGDTIFHAPSYTMYRDERCFVRPLEFIPERWTTQPELTIDSSVYAPFSTGRGACAGKQLGLMEMRYVLTEILSKYDMEFAPETDPEAFIHGLRDCFTLELPDLKMIFTPRGEKEHEAR